MNTAVASLKLDAKHPDGGGFELRIEIGTPYACSGDLNGTWACPLSLDGLYEGLRDQHGANSFQALCLAISLAQELLQDFLEKGGVLLTEGAVFPISSYAFGAARRPS